MKSKATPGPWIIVGGCGRGIIVGPDKLPVVDWDGCASIKRSRSVCNANARLIAAAPELLEAARMALVNATHHPLCESQGNAKISLCDCYILRLRTAIAKAEGE